MDKGEKFQGGKKGGGVSRCANSRVAKIEGGKLFGSDAAIQTVRKTKWDMKRGEK